MPRGGSRTGTPGQAYTQRTDLAASRGLPVSVTRGAPYGTATAQASRQRAVPLAPAAPLTPPPPGSASSKRPPASRVLGPLDRPTERPDEPLTAGLPVGPGPGPEVLGGVPDDDALDAEALAPYLPTLELMASSPGASVATRNFVRRLRSAAPMRNG